MAVSNLIGSSSRFQAVLKEISLVAPADCAVLLHGETGTGKEVIARAIHDASPRHRNSFIAVNCAAIPNGLIESELFGHVKGAFTGTVTQTQGRFQTAHLGTLFLDEIGDLALELQPKLLRALQEQQFERLGSNQTCHVNVRVIAATNQDLWRMVQQRKFRADLYYRLNVFPITLPSLRERMADVPLLANHFMKTFAARQGKLIDRIPDEVMDAMISREWPGNIRELQNWIERAVIMTKGSDLCLPGPVETPVGKTRPWGFRTLAEADRDHILAALKQARGVVGGANGAAARLGLPRTTLIARMEKLGIARRPIPNTFSGHQNGATDEHSRQSGGEGLEDRSTWCAGQQTHAIGDDGFARYAAAGYNNY